MEKTQLNEHSRTYIFENGSLTFENIVEFSMPGTTHRLKLKSGEHVIVAAGWLAIVIEGIEDWTI